MQGKVINGFELKRLLGRGGMAEVWYAENEIGKPAAVKILNENLSYNQNIVERFHNEALVMVKLDHPNIRQVYGYGYLGNRHGIIMEYLEGNDLEAFMKKGRQYTDEELRRWWNQIVDALNFTHSMGVVHRDIKPSNLFLDKRGNIKLLDFGISKIRESISMTQTGSMMGTLMYMSPEQVRDPKRVDYRTDLYSLAVTFVHLLTGQAPYDSTTTSDFDIQLNIVMKPLDMSGVPASWRAFLEPYLEKELDKRPALQEFVERTASQESEMPKASPDVVVKQDEEPAPVENQPIVQKTIEVKEIVQGAAIVTQPSGDLMCTVNGVSFVMKRIEGGTFNMGAYFHLYKRDMPNFDSSADSDESPVHKVALDTYYLGEMEVTKRLYNAILGSSDNTDIDLPQSNISWNDCQKMIERLNELTGKQFRLPTEAEWEYAARGGENSNGFRYAGSDNINDVAWYEGNSDSKPHPVGQKQPNELGLYDMSGNLVEWCGDRYGDYPKEKQTNPQGPDEGTYRVLRGGGWGFVAQRCRVSHRLRANADARSGSYGFRIALSAQQ